MSSSLNAKLDIAAKSIAQKLTTILSQEQKKSAPAYGVKLSSIPLPGKVHVDYNKGRLSLVPTSILNAAKMQILNLS
jgi:hypothetical protein